MNGDKIEGYLTAGIAWNAAAGGYEVVVNFPETERDSAHHVKFSVNQARLFGVLLLRKAEEAVSEPPP